ncbi:MAG: carbonic anhydrase [Prochloraceae cyanobacterium]
MKKLIEGLRKFQSNYVNTHRQLFEELSLGQHPRTLFITCSDSRVDPNLITQAEIGELFVIRNAGNIIPPYRAANGGEGAALEYAVAELKVKQIIVCGHSKCGAMKGLLKMDSLSDKLPDVYDWLKHAEATRRLVKDNYSHFEGDELLEITVANNILNQLDNLQTYPVVRSGQHQGNLSLHGWIYRIETGEVLAYDPVIHDFVAPHSRLRAVEPEYNFHPNCRVPGKDNLSTPVNNAPDLPVSPHLSPEQTNRIYRGSSR